MSSVYIQPPELGGNNRRNRPRHKDRRTVSLESMLGLLIALLLNSELRARGPAARDDGEDEGVLQRPPPDRVAQQIDEVIQADEPGRLDRGRRGVRNCDGVISTS